MEIKVEGEAERRVAPELAVLSVNLESEGTNRERVVRAVGVLSREFAEAVTPLEPSAIRGWTLEPVQLLSWTVGRRGNTSRFAASASATVTFHDRQALADFCLAWGERDGVELCSTAWRLTPETEEAVETELLTEAVKQARRRAEILAAASGAAITGCTHLSDHWVSGARGKEEPVAMKRRMRETSSFSSAPEARPEDLLLSVRVYATFEAD